MTQSFISMIKSLAVMTVVFGSCLTASAVNTVTEGFDNFKAGWNSSWTAWEVVMPDGWDYVDSNRAYSADKDTYKTKAPSVCSDSNNSSSYLITPDLEGDFSFYIRNYTKSYQAVVKAYACTFENGTLTLGTELGSKTLAKTSSGSPSWEKVTFSAPTAQGTRVALLISRAYFDDFSYTPYEQAVGPCLFVSDYASGSTCDLGAVCEGATHTFTLNNSGQAELTITNLGLTGGYTFAEGADLTTIAAGASANVTISTPAVDTIGTLTIVSNDANSPYVINLKSTYKSPAPVMVISAKELNFGKVRTDASADFVISNTGDAELNVLIVSDNEGFSVSPTSLTVVAGDKDTVSVTFAYNAEACGSHTASIIVTPNVGVADTIAVSAFVIDPDLWTEEFNDNKLPDGWSIIGTESKWVFANGVASASYEPNGWLVTPRLAVGSGQSLTFQARSKQFGTDVKVQYQKDGGAWSEKLNEARNTQSDFETYTIEGLEAGNYRFRIATENLVLDNFEGFKLAPVEEPSDTIVPVEPTDTVEAVRDTLYVSYTFFYPDSKNNWQSIIDTEQMEVITKGDSIALNFPNPINGNSWMKGRKDDTGSIVFTNGQPIAKYGSDNAYYCGTDGEKLTDMTFYYNETSDSYLCPGPILINSSTTAMSYWFYFVNVLISKEEPISDAIHTVANSQQTKANGQRYDLQGRRVAADSHLKPGLYIINGKKVLFK